MTGTRGWGWGRHRAGHGARGRAEEVACSGRLPAGGGLQHGSGGVPETSPTPGSCLALATAEWAVTAGGAPGQQNIPMRPGVKERTSSHTRFHGGSPGCRPQKDSASPGQRGAEDLPGQERSAGRSGARSDVRREEWRVRLHSKGSRGGAPGGQPGGSGPPRMTLMCAGGLR